MIEIGAYVRIKGSESTETARVQLYIGNVQGCVFLDCKLGGYQYWDIEDLEEVVSKWN